MNVFIIGSCVTRDAFTKNLLSQDFNLVRYAARTSLARFASGSKQVEPAEINLKSDFQKRMVVNDIGNRLHHDIKQLKDSDIDFLIIDMVSDRFGLVEYKDIFIFNSDELRNSNFINVKDAYKINSNTEEYVQRWEAGLLELLKYIPKEKVIINNVYWAKETELGEKLSNPERIAFSESVLNTLYTVAKKYIPRENFVNYPKNIFVGDSKHQWGKSPIHYIRPVYDYLIEFLINRFELMNKSRVRC